MSAEKSHDQPDNSSVGTISVPPVHYLTDDEAREIFEQQAQHYLGMSGDEFLDAWDSGKFDDGPERPEVMHVVMLIPLVR